VTINAEQNQVQLFHSAANSDRYKMLTKTCSWIIITNNTVKISYISDLRFSRQLLARLLCARLHCYDSTRHLNPEGSDHSFCTLLRCG